MPFDMNIHSTSFGYIGWDISDRLGPSGILTQHNNLLKSIHLTSAIIQSNIFLLCVSIQNFVPKYNLFFASFNLWIVHLWLWCKKPVVMTSGCWRAGLKGSAGWWPLMWPWRGRPRVWSKMRSMTLWQSGRLAHRCERGSNPTDVWIWTLPLNTWIYLKNKKQMYKR